MRYSIEAYPDDDTMKRQLLDILACPVCKFHPLHLEPTKETDKEVVEGKLTCPRCRIDYPITDNIPDLVSPDPK
jgi:uncharacterized protein YbaR (Trm112 family)